LDRGDQCGCFGTKIIVYGWVLMELCIVKQRAKKKRKKKGEKKDEQGRRDGGRPESGWQWLICSECGVIG
jgi:hypothetical protein